MFKYDYQIIAASGAQEKGTIEAASERDAVRALRQKGHQVVKITLAVPTKSLLKTKITSAAILQWIDELVTLLRAGVTLVDAIDSLAEAQFNETFAEELQKMSRILHQGEDFSVALESSALNLPPYVVQLAKAGELSGHLAKTLSEALEQMRFDENLKAETKNALVYPTVLVVSGVAAVLLVFTVVVPKFTNLLKDGVDLPWLAEKVLKTGLFFNQHSLFIFVAIALSIALVVSQLRKSSIRQRCLEALSTAPLIGQWLTESETGRWTSVLGALLSSGVPLMESLALANSGINIQSRRAKLEAAAQSVKSGQSLSSALKEQEALLPTAYNILMVGEKAGELPAMLKSLSELYEKNSRNRMQRMLVLIEPLAILIIGGVIGCIMLGVVLAITASSDIPI